MPIFFRITVQFMWWIISPVEKSHGMQRNTFKNRWTGYLAFSFIPSTIKKTKFKFKIFKIFILGNTQVHHREDASVHRKILECVRCFSSCSLGSSGARYSKFTKATIFNVPTSASSIISNTINFFMHWTCCVSNLEWKQIDYSVKKILLSFLICLKYRNW